MSANVKHIAKRINQYDKGKSTFLIAVTLQEFEITKQIKEEIFLRKQFAELLHSKGYKFAVFDQDCIKQEVLDNLEE